MQKTKPLLILLRIVGFIILSTLLFSMSDRMDQSDQTEKKVNNSKKSKQQKKGINKEKKGKKKQKTVYIFPIDDSIFESALKRTKDGLKEAKENNADFIIIKLNTYGGRVDIADTISKRLLDNPATTIAFIDNNAASAGALISISCDSIYMVESGRIGAATVVNQEGKQAPDKYQSYMRATMRAVAESNGRNAKIAEAMVDDRIKIKGIIDSGKTLTFTTKEAIKHNFCEAEVKTTDDIIARLNLKNPIIIEFKETAMHKFIKLLLSPVLRSLLVMIIFGGLYFELQTPGVGFPLLAAVIAAITYFMPLYIEGLAANWEIALFIVGVILLALEIFVIPGFGVAGVSGLVCIVGGLVLAMLGNDYFDFTFTPPTEISKSFFIVLIGLLVSVIGFFVLGGSMTKMKAFDKVTLSDRQMKEDGYAINTFKDVVLVGKRGFAVTDLKPSGKVEIENERYDAISEAEFLKKGDNIEVLEKKSNHLLVRKV